MGCLAYGVVVWATTGAKLLKPSTHNCTPSITRPAFQFGHPGAFALASRLKAITPTGLDYAFFTNSGSETVDTALKMARAYWRLKGKPGKRGLLVEPGGITG